MLQWALSGHTWSSPLWCQGPCVEGGLLRKVLAFPWCSLQPSLMLGSWEMSGEGAQG